MTGPDLFAVTRRHDLPPKWDGRRVEWEPWRALDVLICPPPKPAPCPACGSLTPSIHATGTVYPLTGDSREIPHVKRTRRSGRQYIAGTVAVPVTPGRVLHAYRCPDCHFDVVWDTRTDEWWDLDPTDYEDTGSTHP